MTVKRQHGFWALFGKLSAILMAIATLLGIYLTLFPEKPKLIVIADYHSYALPPNLVESLERVREKESSPFLQHFLRETMEMTDSTSGSADLSEVSRKLEAVFEQAWGHTWSRFFSHSPFYSPWPYEIFAQLVVENRGARPVEEIVLNAPLDGIASVTYPDESQKTLEITRQIELGSLRPHQKITLAIWSKHRLFQSDEKKFVVTHADGTGEVSFSTTVRGFPKFLVDNWVLMAALAWGIVLATVFIISLRGLINQVASDAREGKESKKTAKESSPDAEPESEPDLARDNSTNESTTTS